MHESVDQLKLITFINQTLSTIKHKILDGLNDSVSKLEQVFVLTQSIILIIDHYICMHQSNFYLIKSQTNDKTCR